MYKRDLFVVAYEKLKSVPGNMTPGADGTTLDEFSLRTIEKIVAQMRDESFQFSRARRVHIPKANGKTRPLGIAPPRDKIVQEVMRMILEAIYDSPHGSSFSDDSHGFRPNRGCHTALKSIRNTWSGVTWIIEGDVKAAFDCIDHDILISILRRRIKDERFLNLIRKALTAGYYEFKRPVESHVGTPQGSIVSPILCNIFLHELDEFVAGLTATHEKGDKKRTTTEYNYRRKQIVKVRSKLNAPTYNAEERKELLRELKALLIAQKRSSQTRDDGSFIRVKYVRYADDWCVGINGPKHLAVQIRDEVKSFMAKKLGLTLSMEKTHIRHAKDEEAFFLGTRFKVGADSQKVVGITDKNGRHYQKRVTGWLPQMFAPCDRLVARLNSRGFCDKNGNPIAKSAWIALDDDQIVAMAGAVLRGLVNYYSFVDNYSDLRRIQYILKYSAAKTLAGKHRTSIRRIFLKHGDQLAIEKTHYGKTAFLAFPTVFDWTRNPTRFKVGELPTPDHVFQRNQRLRTRSKLGVNCVICGSDEKVVMHHIRHVRKMGAKVWGFSRLMATLNRKQIPACTPCHIKVHKGVYDGLKLSDLYDPITAAR
ncbi:reverse transcriptase domain-containing protein [Cupriavidus sp. IK-TO18]|uniref:reverse transcriptase domain-containing protein n=1 Tax=Cupriavidus sp. IK-TO18 TaxID=2782182 RepID=UPI001C553041|nr:reverse transcriptase domain-containing protein [Cupriavidus sp. IK-TO18]